MSNATQCPSTVGTKTAPEERPLSRDAAGRAYWRSLDELAGTARFRDFAEREFPALASELTGDSRRHFLKVMGASLALAGAATIPGCRRPDHKILPFAKLPEEIIEGRPTFYASSYALPGGGAEGVLVETFSGRPTKIEGNPLHPASLGKSSVRAQAEILDLYDPERLQSPATRGTAGGEMVAATWREFDRAMDAMARTHEDDQGAGLYVLAGKTTSPTRDRLRDALLEKYPRASWLPYEAIDRENEIDGTTSALGAPHRAELKLDTASVIVSLDDDFLAGEGASLTSQRGFAAGRKVDTVDDEMNRLYAVESGLSATGMAADHRLALKPSQIAHYAAALAQAVVSRRGGATELTAALSTHEHNGALSGVESKWIDEVAKDLIAHAPRAVVTVGESQPPVVHALAVAMNSALGAIGRTVEYRPLTGDAAVKSSDSMRTLGTAAARKSIRTLICLERNPVYDAPADVRAALVDNWDNISSVVALSLGHSETSDMATWSLNAAHWLESWGDVRGWDGTISPVQPMIKPLYDGRSSIELLAQLAGVSGDAYELVRGTWRASNGLFAQLGFDKGWRRALHDGVVSGSASPARVGSLNAGAIAQSVSQIPPATNAIEATFVADPSLWDGRNANNGWLQELPDPIAKIAWDNPIFVSPKTAERLGFSGWLGTIGEQKAPVARVIINGRAVEAPVWRVPGMADDAVVITMGNGRSSCGRVGDNEGVNTFALRSLGVHRLARDVTLEKAGRTVPVACTQDHGTMEGVEGAGDRPMLRELDIQAFRKHGREREHYTDAYGRSRELNPAQKLGTESHAPALETIYQEDQRHDYSKRDEWDAPKQQWGMSIDLNTCIGCNVCTISCQAENNIPVVGKAEVNKGREMHWIRVDRYFIGDEEHGGVGAASMPVACVHCENAPCETVCPVNATVHSPSGLNVMAYNRCIGTRYCSNNCPYKVRRFNFFDYATKRMGGDYPLRDVLGDDFNEHMIPPRLREVNPEVKKMGNNPHVTVRERGVMEKCSYCIQRINEARVEYRKLRKDEIIPDGSFQTACQQACPTNAIVFGDINDHSSNVYAARNSMRSYALLDYLNTLPRTTYQARLRNPNPAIRQPVLDPFHHGEDGHHAHGEPHADDGHNTDHSTDAHGGGHSTGPKREPGHIMSLSVLPAGTLLTGGRA